MEVKKEFEQLLKDNVKCDIKGNHDHDVDLPMPKNVIPVSINGFVAHISDNHSQLEIKDFDKFIKSGCSAHMSPNEIMSIVKAQKNHPSDDYVKDLINTTMEEIAKEEAELEEAGRRHRENRNNIHATPKFPSGTKIELIQSKDEARKVENCAELHVQDDEFTMDF
ncbi:MAG: hypothetical protein IK070_03025 [Clostridia bacterium]|nr:hypothetical protein [Clostridia bacterium]